MKNFKRWNQVSFPTDLGSGLMNESIKPIISSSGINLGVTSKLRPFDRSLISF